MSGIHKFLTSVALVALLTCGSSLWQSLEARRPMRVDCTIDIVHTTRAQDGTIIGTELYTRDFVLTEGTNFDEDYSTPTRLKFFGASLQNVRDQAIISVDWFADVSVFNSADFRTALTLVKGQNDGEISASHTFSTSSGHSTTTYTLTGSRR